MEKVKGRGYKRRAAAALAFAKCLLAALFITGVLLLLTAFLLFKFSLTEKAISVAVAAIYALSAFASGFLAGKVIGTRRLFWGLMQGVAYFVILAICSVATGGRASIRPDSALSAFILCAAGGALGGILS